MTTNGIVGVRRRPEFLNSVGLRRLVEEAQTLNTLELRAQAILAGARSLRGRALPRRRVPPPRAVSVGPSQSASPGIHSRSQPYRPSRRR